MLGTYISAALICAAALLVGRALLAVLGRREWSWLEPPVGLAALITVAGFFVRGPGHAKSGAIAVVLLLLASLAALRLPYRYRSALARGLPVAIAIGLVTAIPFAVSGRFGLIGVGFNNDLGLHLAWSQWLRDGLGSAPDAGYPLGPHGIATTVAILTGIGLGKAFTGLLIAIAVLTGLTALAPLGELGPLRRTFGAVLVTFAYLAASYFAQSAFKETAEVLFVLGFALALPTLRPFPPGRSDRLLALAPPAVICAGIVFSYSLAGLAWPLATLAIWGLTIPEVRSALAPRKLLRRAARPAGIAVLLAAAGLLLLGVFGPFGFGKGFVQVQGSNTYGPTSPAEAFGFWAASNYRLEAPGSAPLGALTTAIAVIAVICGLIWWMRRREPAVPAALAAAALIYLLNLTPLSGDYVRSKALMILAPLAMLVAVRALLSAPWPGWRLPRAAWAALAAVFLAGAAYSSFLVLRDAPVAPPGHGIELRAFLPKLEGKHVLYAGQDRFAVYELRDSDAHVPVVEFADEEVVERPSKPFDAGDHYSPIDFDSFSPGTLDRFDYVITSAGAYMSQPPRNFKQVQRTGSYKLWQRRGPTPGKRQTLLEGGAPAAHVDCRTPEQRIFASTPGGRATLFPRPYVARQQDWSGGPYLHTGEQTSQELELPAGTWRLSLQYFSPFTLHLTAVPPGGPPLQVRLKPALDGQRPNQLSLYNNGQYWPVGTLRVPQAGPVKLTIRADGADTLQSITGYDGSAYLGELAATPNAPERTVRLGRSCGHWVDWYAGRVSP